MWSIQRLTAACLLLSMLGASCCKAALLLELHPPAVDPHHQPSAHAPATHLQHASSEGQGISHGIFSGSRALHAPVGPKQERTEVKSLHDREKLMSIEQHSSGETQQAARALSHHSSKVTDWAVGRVARHGRAGDRSGGRAAQPAARVSRRLLAGDIAKTALLRADFDPDEDDDYSDGAPDHDGGEPAAAAGVSGDTEGTAAGNAAAATAGRAGTDTPTGAPAQEADGGATPVTSKANSGAAGPGATPVSAPASTPTATAAADTAATQILTTAPDSDGQKAVPGEGQDPGAHFDYPYDTVDEEDYEYGGGAAVVPTSGAPNPTSPVLQETVPAAAVKIRTTAPASDSQKAVPGAGQETKVVMDEDDSQYGGGKPVVSPSGMASPVLQGTATAAGTQILTIAPASDGQKAAPGAGQDPGARFDYPYDAVDEDDYQYGGGAPVVSTSGAASPVLQGTAPVPNTQGQAAAPTAASPAPAGDAQPLSKQAAQDRAEEVLALLKDEEEYDYSKDEDYEAKVAELEALVAAGRPKAGAATPASTQPTHGKKYKPRMSDALIVDKGYPDRPRGWFDAQCQGVDNDYCRYVGPHADKFWSCALAGGTEQYSPRGQFLEAFTHKAPCPHPVRPRMAPPSLTDFGFPDRPRGWYDAQCQGAVNDYCRYVGDKSKPYWSCALAGTITQYSLPGIFQEAATSQTPCLPNQKTQSPVNSPTASPRTSLFPGGEQGAGAGKGQAGLGGKQAGGGGGKVAVAGVKGSLEREKAQAVEQTIFGSLFGRSVAPGDKAAMEALVAAASKHKVNQGSGVDGAGRRVAPGQGGGLTGASVWNINVFEIWGLLSVVGIVLLTLVALVLSGRRWWARSRVRGVPHHQRGASIDVRHGKSAGAGGRHGD